MLISISLLHFIFVLIFILISIKCLYKNRSLLAFVAIGFVILDSMGLAFAPYLPLESIQYLPNPTFLITKQNTELYMRQILAHWIFLFVSLMGILIRLSWLKEKTVYEYSKNMNQKYLLWSLVFLFIGIVASIKYFFIGPGLKLLITTKLSFSSTAEAIASRSEVRDTVQFGQGAYLALLASTIIFPLSALFYIKSKFSGGKFFVFVCFLLSFAYAFQTRQKAPVLAVISSYLLLTMSHRQIEKGLNLKRLKRFFILALLTGLIGGITLYKVNFGLSLSTAIISVFARLFVIPGATETNFFAVFPDYYGYRGLTKILNIPLRHANDDVSIYDVAYKAIGDYFSSNASFIAVAWSGFGYIGVMIISFLIIGVLLLLDWMLLKANDEMLYLGVLALTFQSTLMMASGSLLSYISHGGLIIPLLAIVIRFIVVRVKLKKVYFKGIRIGS